MPMYSYKCTHCGVKQSVFKRIAQLSFPEFCQLDNHEMQRVIEAPAVRGDYEGYKCPITDKWIEGRRAHEENLKKHGCRVFEPGEREQQIAARRKADEAFEETIANSAAEFVEALPARKREQLATELSNGVDVQLTRV